MIIRGVRDRCAVKLQSLISNNSTATERVPPRKKKFFVKLFFIRRHFRRFVSYYPFIVIEFVLMFILFLIVKRVIFSFSTLSRLHSVHCSSVCLCPRLKQIAWQRYKTDLTPFTFYLFCNLIPRFNMNPVHRLYWKKKLRKILFRTPLNRYILSFYYFHLNHFIFECHFIYIFFNS